MESFPAWDRHGREGRDDDSGPGGSPVTTKFVRIVMTRSSNTCDTHGSADRRNCVGYAIRELYLGTIDSKGEFKDLLHHSPDQKQTLTLCSSVDPWHEPSDLYVAPDRMESGDQPGFDLFFTSGITRGLPAIVPIAMLYATPEDAAAQMTYIKKRGYPVSYVEMGEEPDGQYMQPEDYAALYLQFATALHRVDPNFKLGGPVFEGVTEDIKVWPDAQGRTSWLGRFLDYLKSHGRMQDLAFMSFEHYPYDGCETPWENLYQEPELITHIMKVWRDDGLPPGIPLLDTETNAHGGEASVDIFGALWLADSFAGFSERGRPVHALLSRPVLLSAASGLRQQLGDLPPVHGGRSLRDPAAHRPILCRATHHPGMGRTERRRASVNILASSDVKDSQGHVLVTAYALHRPDGQWSLMLINKDHDHPHQVRIAFHDVDNKTRRIFQRAGRDDYVRKGTVPVACGRKKGHADPDGPAVTSKLDGEKDKLYNLPVASLTVLRGQLSSETP